VKTWKTVFSVCRTSYSIEKCAQHYQILPSLKNLKYPALNHKSRCCIRPIYSVLPLSEMFFRVSRPVVLKLGGTPPQWGVNKFPGVNGKVFCQIYLFKGAWNKGHLLKGCVENKRFKNRCSRLRRDTVAPPLCTERFTSLAFCGL